jgi:capsular exopolysaccharide synthesis family protein
MARVSLLEEEGGTRVIELTAPSSAYIVGPNLAKTLGIGTFIGLALGAGLALLLEKNANTFRDPDEISELLGVPVLTHVPCFKGKLRKGKEGEDEPFKKLDPYLAVIHSPASVPAEAIRTCRTSVFFETAAIKGGKVIQVTSPLPGDGKSTIAGNLACSIAQSGKTVLAIDCDLRRPQLSKNFALSDDLGLTNTLNGDCEPSDAIHETPLPGLSVMPSGPIPANPAEALTLPEMAELLEHCRDQYDYIIIDTPPLLVVTDPSITASMTDGVLLTVRIRRKSRPNARESMNILRAVGANVLGVAINNSDEAGSSDGYRGYGYYRYGRYTRQYRKGYAQTSSKKGKRKNSTASSSLVVSGRGAAREAKPIDDEGDLRRDVVGAQASSKNHS